MSLIKNIYLIIICIGLIAVGVVFFSKPFLTFEDLCIANVPDNYVNIYGQHTVGQVFIPKYPNLCRVGFFIFKNKEKKADLIFHLKSSLKAQEDILKLVVKGADLYNNYYPFMLPPLNTKKGSIYFFEFEPLNYSAGQPLYFYLESTNTEQDNGIKVGYLENIFQRGNAGGSSYLNGTPWDGYLAFHTYYWWDGNLGDVGKEIFKRLMRDRNFAVSHLILSLNLLVAIFTVNHKLKLVKQ